MDVERFLLNAAILSAAVSAIGLSLIGFKVAPIGRLLLFGSTTAGGVILLVSAVEAFAAGLFVGGIAQGFLAIAMLGLVGSLLGSRGRELFHDIKFDRDEEAGRRRWDIATKQYEGMTDEERREIDAQASEWAKSQPNAPVYAGMSAEYTSVRFLIASQKKSANS